MTEPASAAADMTDDELREHLISAHHLRTLTAAHWQRAELDRWHVVDTPGLRQAHEHP